MKKTNDCMAIKVMLIVSLIFQLLYMVISCVLSSGSSFALRLVTGPILDEVLVDIPNLLGVLFTTVAGILLFVLLWNVIKNNKRLSGVWVVLVGVFTFVAYIIIPTATRILQTVMSNRMYVDREISLETYSYVQAVISLESYAMALLFVAVVMQLCSYVMYWTKMKYIHVNAER